MIFGGDGIFLVALTGPGRIWLQTLPIASWRTLLRNTSRESLREKQSAVVWWEESSAQCSTTCAKRARSQLPYSSVSLVTASSRAVCPSRCEAPNMAPRATFSGAKFIMPIGRDRSS